MLANLLFVSHDSSEIGSRSDAAAWAGMPEYDAGTERLQVVVSCDNEEDRISLLKLLEVTAAYKRGTKWTVWWPPREREDLASLKFDQDA